MENNKADTEDDFDATFEPVAQSLSKEQKQVTVLVDGVDPETKYFAMRLIEVLSDCGFECIVANQSYELR